MTARLRIIFDTRDTQRAFRRLRKRGRRVAAQTLNRQRRQFRTGVTRGLARDLRVRPQKRIRRRVLAPRGGTPTPRNLAAEGLVLVALMPQRYFRKAGKLVLPRGTRLVQADQGPVVDASAAASRVRVEVASKLSREFPAEFRRRMRIEALKIGLGAF